MGANVENLTLGGESAIDGAGNDSDNILTGNSAANALTGGSGNDTLNGAGSADTMSGGIGDDLYYVDDASDSILGNSAEGNDSVISSVDLTLAANVENLILTGSALSATGNSDNNCLTGTDGANTLLGADGDDSLDGRAGIDSRAGGTGSDTYFVDSASGAVVETAAPVL